MSAEQPHLCLFCQKPLDSSGLCTKACRQNRSTCLDPVALPTSASGTYRFVASGGLAEPSEPPFEPVEVSSRVLMGTAADQRVASSELPVAMPSDTPAVKEHDTDPDLERKDSTDPQELTPDKDPVPYEDEAMADTLPPPAIPVAESGIMPAVQSPEDDLPNAKAAG